MSLAGGGSNSNYRASFNYLKSDGIMKDNDMDRYNFRFQLQQRAINDRLRIGLTGSATMRDFNQPNRRNFVLAYNMLPVYPVKTSDGRSEEHTSELQSRPHLVCRLLLEKKKNI